MSRLISERAGGSTHTYHGDQIASTRGLTDSSQSVTASRERDAWGNVIASSGTLAAPFGFVGGGGYQQDTDSGLMLLGARCYDPSVGRFISRDPIGTSGGVNVYLYTLAHPTGIIDTDGRRPEFRGRDETYREAALRVMQYWLDQMEEYRQRWRNRRDYYTDCGKWVGSVVHFCGDQNYPSTGTFIQWNYIVQNPDLYSTGLVNYDRNGRPTNLQTGDILFYSGGEGGGGNHTAVYIRDNNRGGGVIGASHGDYEPQRRNVHPGYVHYARPRY